jgi:hypothetical protein
VKVGRLVRLAAVLAVGGACLPAPAEAAPGPPVPQCNGGGCSGDWYKSAITVTWAYDPVGVTGTSGCGPATVSEDTGGATFTCTVNYGGPFYGNSVTVRKDSSPPSVDMRVSRDPDSGDWYTKPVEVIVSGGDGASGLASCSGGGTYSGPDSGGATVSGSCSDNAGNSASGSMTLKYDGSPPTVAATPARPPDANGWYNHPVDVAFTGTDAGSGIKECTPTAAYKGPDANPAKLVAQCKDAAGHASQAITVELRYDATPPAQPSLKWSHRGEAIAFNWTAAPDVTLVRLVRAPGLKSKTAEVVYQGTAKRFLDRKIKIGTKYWYELRVFDQAGNSAARTVGSRPLAGIMSPANGSVVSRAPVVAWAPTKSARFYNVQLWRGREKLLTTWVRAPKLALKQRWTTQGKRQTLVNGPYRVYVWPAFGTTKNPRYGKLLGQVSFVVRRR